LLAILRESATNLEIFVNLIVRLGIFTNNRVLLNQLKLVIDFGDDLFNLGQFTLKAETIQLYNQPGPKLYFD
jgi:hypothetical protein